MDEARAIIARLGLAPHPEGGWYRETWRAAPGADGRARGTAIHFLLEQGQRSH
ncbi:cupin, partial [Herbaspirillum sp. HC18]